MQHTPEPLLPRGTLTIFILLAITLAGGIVLQAIFPHGMTLSGAGNTQVTDGRGPIRINELMSSNKNILADDMGLTPDWLEVQNISNHDVNLYGYALAHDENSANVFYFQDEVLSPGECVVVYCDGTSLENRRHAPFRLSSLGGSVMLFNRSGTRIDECWFPALPADTSYARQEDGGWLQTEHPTPGRPNTEGEYQAMRTPDSSSGVIISAIAASNRSLLQDETGAYYDFFILENTSGSPVDIGGWFVSDDPSRPFKWRLPDGIVLLPEAEKVIFASKQDRSDTEYPHTNFALSSGGETLTLTDASGQLIDRLAYPQAQTDVLYER